MSRLRTDRQTLESRADSALAEFAILSVCPVQQIWIKIVTNMKQHYGKYMVHLRQIWMETALFPAAWLESFYNQLLCNGESQHSFTLSSFVFTKF